MHAFAADVANHLLSELAKGDALESDLRLMGEDAHNVSVFEGAIKPEKEIRGGQMKEMQSVRLQHLAKVQQSTKLFCGRCQLIDAHQLIDRLGGRKMVADRTDSAQALHHHRQLFERSAFDEPLKSPELHDVKAGLMHLVVGIHEQGYLAMALDPGNRVNDDAAKALAVRGGFRNLGHQEVTG